MNAQPVCPDCGGSGVVSVPSNTFNWYDDDGNGLGCAVEEEVPCERCSTSPKPKEPT